MTKTPNSVPQVVLDTSWPEQSWPVLLKVIKLHTTEAPQTYFRAKEAYAVVEMLDESVGSCHCSYCNKAIDTYYNYCNYCGARIVGTKVEKTGY